MKEILVKGGTAEAFEVRKGGKFKLTDVVGGQVADFVAFNRNDLKEKSSPGHTRISNRSLRLKTGDSIRSNLRHEMIRLLEETAGHHDILIVACDEQRYLVDYGVADHRSCVNNFEQVLGRYGIDRWVLPDPVNFFQHTRIGDDGEIIQLPSVNPGGSFVMMEAMMDLVCAVSACPMDLNPIGGSDITDILVTLYD
ncbi:MAG: urea carboxylase-associated family protein [Thermovirgaceae bacterium]|nr:urea carboxylase-associated family protein [Synergistales bacterium]HPC76012.1 urea carboxylase-associated family protein [Synergistales bacterium]HRS48849.1 urea carboxylase-associated family protein [Thermovirgaceae bacterium]HRU90893.1 urea carboxylase-associated family protein [Thermovirgaceae bacterium]